MGIPVSTSTSFLTEHFTATGFVHLTTYRDTLEIQRDIELESNLTYYPKFVMIEAGYMALTALLTAEAIVRYVAAWGLYAYNLGVSTPLTERAFEMAERTAAMAVWSLYSVFAHLFVDQLDDHIVSLSTP